MELGLDIRLGGVGELGQLGGDVLAPSGRIELSGDEGLDAGGDAGGLSVLATDAFLFGRVDARGGGWGARGGQGGRVVIESPGGATAGALVLAGPVDVSGGFGDAAGGDGGEVSIGGEGAVHVSGGVDARGGWGASGGGGGTVRLAGGAATVFTGAIVADGGFVSLGGSAPSSGGGEGGLVEIGPSRGPVWCEGSVYAWGGSGGDSAAAGRGGVIRVGLAERLVQGGPLVFSGTLWAVGGGLGSEGGDGGTVELSGAEVRASLGSAGSVSAHGGRGGTGGAVVVSSAGTPSIVAVPIDVYGIEGEPGTVTVDGSLVPLLDGIYYPTLP